MTHGVEILDNEVNAVPPARLCSSPEGMGAPLPIKLRLYRAPEQVLINCYCPFGADRLHVAMLPASQNAIWITRAPIDPEFDALALADVLSPYRRPEPSRH